MLGIFVNLLAFGMSSGPSGVGQIECIQVGQSMSASQGVVFLIDGVGGFGFAPKMMEKVLVETGVNHEVRTFYWSHGFGRWHADLTDDANFRSKASELANSAMDFRVQCPRGPIYIVAKSGGTAIALAALAQLPAKSVERCVLLSSAVSPDYDLVPSLCAIRTELVSFWSPRDKLVLGLGTSIFGTADGVMGQSAGLVGFRAPEGADAETVAQYRKLRQVEWDPTMRRTYNFGTHIGTSMPQFVRIYVAPLLGEVTDTTETIVRVSGTE
jgi:pimeloyl-ACP methyl ester carboxylesterase